MHVASSSSSSCGGGGGLVSLQLASNGRKWRSHQLKLVLAQMIGQVVALVGRCHHQMATVRVAAAKVMVLLLMVGLNQLRATQTSAHVA